MSASVWRRSPEVPGFDLEVGQEVPVVVGLVETAAGGGQAALRIGEGQLVILALQAGHRLIEHVAAAMTERLESDQP